MIDVFLVKKSRKTEGSFGCRIETGVDTDETVCLGLVTDPKLIRPLIVRTSNRVFLEVVVRVIPPEDVEVVMVALNVEPIGSRTHISPVDGVPVHNPFLLEDSGSHWVSGSGVSQVSGGQHYLRTHYIDIFAAKPLEVWSSLQVENNTYMDVRDLRRREKISMVFSWNVQHVI